jgi:hypothetical protein
MKMAMPVFVALLKTSVKHFEAETAIFEELVAALPQPSSASHIRGFSAPNMSWSIDYYAKW